MRSVTLASLLLILAWPSPVSAQWRQDGVPACQAFGGQYVTSACPDGSGGVFIAWDDTRNYTTLDDDIYLQHVTASGFIAPGWPQDGVVVCSTTGYQDAPSVTPDGAGGCFVTWIDRRSGTSLDIYAQHVAPSGMPAAGWPDNGLAVCTASGDKRSPHVVRGGAGGCFVQWEDERNGRSNRDVCLDRILADGTLDPAWPVNGLDLTPVSGFQGDASAITDGAGGVFVTWDDGRNRGTTGFDVYLQRVTSSGAIATGWPAGGLAVCNAPGDQGPSLVVPDDAGGAYVAWRDGRTGAFSPFDNWDLYAHHIAASGALVPGWPTNGTPVCNAPRSQFEFAADADGQGNLLVAWEDDRAGSAFWSIYALKLQPGGTLASGWAVNGNQATTAPTRIPKIVRDGSGGAYVAWWDGRNIPSGVDFYAQHFTAVGVPAPGWGPDGLPLCTAADTQEQLQLVSGGSMGAIAAWSDYRNYSVSGPDVYAQRLEVDGPVPALLSLVSAEAEPGLARISWFAADAADLGAVVERRDDASEWLTLGSPDATGTGLLTYEDSVPAGGRYAYRLRYGADRAATEPAWITIPSGLALSLGGFRPNPAVGAISVSLSLPSGDPATLELVDVAGRRLLSRDLAGLGPGSHLIQLGASGTLRPGVYWLRLTQKGRSLTARGLVLR